MIAGLAREEFGFARIKIAAGRKKIAEPGLYLSADSADFHKLKTKANSTTNSRELGDLVKQALGARPYEKHQATSITDGYRFSGYGLGRRI
ncbi:MAG: hypothetical protein C4520_18050 [Candidatus Abyssobacteria bacterium SURF_5]|uniref:Uncharacterized protein n=1 Tax=Abyssobacteria bacterium (strain SURF_5) TaxID=2093360 RepID=A0A3A4NEA7_ABYX5|nr:MAG: hypothetical protein C4520_18050 [Candidatus Abyssubacteria bacterium SURF_5]